MVMKGVEEVEHAEAISKYRDKAEGQRPRNFVKTGVNKFLIKIAVSEGLRVMQECMTKERSR